MLSGAGKASKPEVGLKVTYGVQAACGPRAVNDYSCNQTPEIVVVNEGGPITIKRWAINERVGDRVCDREVEVKLSLGEVWHPITNPFTESICGRPIVFDILTDRGAQRFRFGR